MSGQRRVFQVGERIKELVAEHLNRVADPRFNLVTITSVMVSPDLRNAKVYWVVSIFGEAERAERIAEVQEAFDTASGMFRKMASKALGIRFTPELRFYYVENVERLMAKIRPTENS